MRLKPKVIALLSMSMWPFPAHAQSVESLPYRDPALSIEARAADLVGRMALEEKARQLDHAAPAIPRLGLPAYNWWNEGLHGVARAGVATVFPQAIGLAATFDTVRMKNVADVVSTEFRAKFAERVHPDGSSDFYRGLTVWSPNINIFRDPRWGRGQETYGEDPFITARMGVAFIQGLQGDDPKYLKTLATAKHFAVHSGPESNRHREDVHPSAHDLNDTYLPAFRAAVTEAKVGSVMCVYNAVDGIPGCASKPLLQTYLRDRWGFAGYVVSDCGAISDIFKPDAHNYRATPAEGVTAAFEAGTDLFCAFGQNWSAESRATIKAVRDGILQEATIDRALRRIMSARIRLGLFDPPAAVSWSRVTAADNDTPAHGAVALDVAKASLVLLKNDGLLPLRVAPRRIAVIGPNADNLDALVGNYNGDPSHPVTVLAGIRARFPDAQVTYVEGAGLIGPATAPVDPAALCVDEACEQHGVKAEEFAVLGADFQEVKTEGPPLATRIDPAAQVRWNGDRQTVTRWTGFLVPAADGEYRLGYQSARGWRLWIDDALLVDGWNDNTSSIATAAIALRKGRKYRLRVDAIQRGGQGAQQLIWHTPAMTGADAVEAARAADLAIFVGGLSPRIEGEEMRIEAPGFAGGDRTSLDLPAPQQALLEQVTATGKPVVLVLMNGSALGVTWADEHVPAIVEAWYPGGTGGMAVAQLIAGDFSPAGRLPVTFYRSVDQLPAFGDYAMAGRTYRYFGGEPLYPFGYGKSFTTFRYGQALTSAASVAAGGGVTVSADVTNTGGMDGEEVVQLYLTHPGVAGAPLRALAGVQRIALKQGETRRVSFALDDRALSFVDQRGVRRIAPGRIDAWIGGGQPIARAGLPKPAGMPVSFTVRGAATLPD